MSDKWWRHAAIYQIYPRSFADGSGDGLGDIAGIRSRLGYLSDLGVEALWLSPWYVSPQADAGYDVADYRDIDPIFGTLTEAEEFIQDAHTYGIRIIVDIVPNHCSSAHPWFQAALRAGPGSPERDLFWFRPGRGENGEQPPTDWMSNFGGPAWTRVADGEWYLHMFDPGQPDWNWENPRVHEDFATTLRFWLDRGVDGFRIDVADYIVKDPALPDVNRADAGVAQIPDPAVDATDKREPWRDQDGVHEIYREWRKIADSYPQEVAFVGELWIADPLRFTRYLRPDELHTAFNFAFLGCAWEAGAFRQVIDETLATHALVGAPPTWVLSNHDVTRHVTRYGRSDTRHTWELAKDSHPADLALGTKRARAAALLSLGLPGSAYIYQGEELGLPEVQDLPEELLADPRWKRSGHTDRGRDGCRVPLPWSGTEPPFGFGTGGSWLPQPAAWRALTAEAEAADPDSMHSLYREALRIRREHRDEAFTWLPGDESVLAFERGGGFACLVNFGAEPVALPPGSTIVLASGPLSGGSLPADTAAWVRLS
jgi:alpha-glucosidase